jgi:hypothetical protein
MFDRLKRWWNGPAPEPRRCKITTLKFGPERTTREVHECRGEDVAQVLADLEAHGQRPRMFSISTHFYAFAILLLAFAAAEAQTKPVLPVIGSGKIAWDQPAASLADAQALVYKAYVDTRAPINLSATCALNGTVITCEASLAQLNLTTAVSTLAISASLTAADGVIESEKAIAPFDLRRVGIPAAPTGASLRVRPGS